MRTIFAAVGALVVAACATPYQSRGVRGGYSEARLDATTYRVTFKGNAYTNRESVENYLHYRCAEVTLEAGFDYFVLLDANEEERHGSYTTPSEVNSYTTGSATYVGGGTAYGQATTTTTVHPGQTYTWTKHGATALIKVFHGQKPQDAKRAYDAREVVQYLRPSIR
jgi:hypothetical protein